MGGENSILMKYQHYYFCVDETIVCCGVERILTETDRADTFLKNSGRADFFFQKVLFEKKARVVPPAEFVRTRWLIDMTCNYPGPLNILDTRASHNQGFGRHHPAMLPNFLL